MGMYISQPAHGNRTILITEIVAKYCSFLAILTTYGLQGSEYVKYFASNMAVAAMLEHEVSVPVDRKPRPHISGGRPSCFDRLQCIYYQA
jgi:hypothetical protein